MIREDRKKLRRKALWGVSDFAAYLGVSMQRARRLLLHYDRSLGGMLLRPSRGANRGYTFFWAMLARHHAEAFLDDVLETEQRIDTLENAQEEMGAKLRSLGAQTTQNTKDVALIKRRVA